MSDISYLITNFIFDRRNIEYYFLLVLETTTNGQKVETLVYF